MPTGGSRFACSNFERIIRVDTFEKLFGMERSRVGRACVLLPLAGRELGRGFCAPAFSRGMLYGTAGGPGFTLIRTGVGAALAGDAVLHLAETPCEEIILFGSCGLAGSDGGLGIGSLVSPAVCHSAESFTRLLDDDIRFGDAFRADAELRARILSHAGSRKISDTPCLSIGSLKLQEGLLPALRAHGIGLVDMECAAVFAAARRTGRQAAALLYTADIIGEKPFHAPLSAEDRAAMDRAVKDASGILCDLFRKKPRG
jgi:purine-nucleoside phosphorylase